MMLVFNIVNNKAKDGVIQITFDDQPFKLLYSRILEADTALNLESIARNVAYAFFNDSQQALPKRIHVALHNIEASTYVMCFHVSGGKIVKRNVLSAALLLAPDNIVLVDNAKVEENDPLLKNECAVFSASIYQGLANAIWQAPASRLIPLHHSEVSVAPLKAITPLQMRSDEYQAKLTQFKEETLTHKDEDGFIKFKRYEEKVKFLVIELQHLDKARLAFDKIKAEADKLPLFHKDLSQITLKAKSEENKVNYTGDTFGDFFDRMLVEYHQVQAEASVLSLPLKDLENIFLDAENLLSAKQHVKYTVFVGLYNFAVACFNEILSSEPVTRKDKVDLFNLIFAHVSISIDLAKVELISFEQARKSFFENNQHSFPLMAHAIRGLLTAIKDEENKHIVSLTQATSSYVWNAFSGSSANVGPAQLKCLNSLALCGQLELAQGRIDTAIRELFIDQMDSSILYAKFYGEENVGNTQPKPTFSFQRKSNVAYTKLRFASEAQFEWHLIDDDLNKRHDQLKTILVKYSEEEDVLQTFAGLYMNLTNYVDSANNIFLAYWEVRLALYQELSAIQQEAGEVMGKMTKLVETYQSKGLGYELFADESANFDIQHLTQLAKDNVIASNQIVDVRTWLAKLRRSSQDLDGKIQSLKNKAVRLNQWKTEEQGLRDQVTEQAEKLKQNKERLIRCLSILPEMEAEDNAIESKLKESLKKIEHSLREMQDIESGDLKALAKYIKAEEESDVKILLPKLVDKIPRLISNASDLRYLSHINQIALHASNPYQLALMRLNQYWNSSINAELAAALPALTRLLEKATPTVILAHNEAAAATAFAEIIQIFSDAVESSPKLQGLNAMLYTGSVLEPVKEKQLKLHTEIFTLLRALAKHDDYASFISMLKSKIQEIFANNGFKQTLFLVGGIGQPKTLTGILGLLSESSTRSSEELFADISSMAGKACEDGNVNGMRDYKTQALYMALAGGMLPTLDWMNRLPTVAAPVAAPSQSSPMRK